MAQIIHVGTGSGEKRANVIFLHGLGGDPYATWQHGAEQQTFWPRWLLDDLSGLTVYSIGYEAAVSSWTGTAMYLTDRANNVLSRILAEPKLQTGPIAFIGHSLGGLVIKQLLRTAESTARYDATASRFLTRVDKVAFLATPHTGADLARWGDRLRTLVRPTAATASLVDNDPNLRDLNLWYRDWANDHHISHLTLIETDGADVVGTVVKPDSGDPGLANSRPVSISADHFAICKPVDKDHDTYVLVRNFIQTPFERPKSATEEKIEALPELIVAKLISVMSERGQTETAERAGVSRDVIIKLAQRINADVDHFDQALLELERAVTVAAEVAEEGRRGSNTGDLVDEVLKRIAEKSAEGRFEEAAADADMAFAQWERNEKERRHAAIAGGLKLLDAGLKQDILRRDAVSAAKRIEQMVKLEYPEDRAVRFRAMCKRQDEWYESGRRKGLNFDLLVAIEAARLLLASANSPNQIGKALNELGVSLVELGQRDSETDRLKEAVEAHRAALLEHAREHMPLDWAATQNNLGNTLAILGERENSPRHFEDAVEAYRAALLEGTRERVPLDWARSQNNLGNVLNMLGGRESGTGRLEEAVQAYRAALLELTRERAALDWAATQNNLGDVLRKLGQRESGTARLEEAVDAFRAASMERTRASVPLDWAATQANLGIALMALGEREDGTKRLEEAVEAHCAALLEYTSERAPYWHDRTQNLLARVLKILEQRRKEEAG